MQLYHGSEEARTEFADQASRRFTLGRSYSVTSPASFFTPDEDYARTFGDVVTIVELDHAKVLDLTEGAWGVGDPAAYAILEARFGEEVGMQDPSGLWVLLDEVQDVQALRELGYHAVAFRERDAAGIGHDTFGVFDRGIIKVVDHQFSSAPRGP